jgi:group I intron endonuclease
VANQKISSIYAIRCKTTGKVYIGRSYNPHERMKQHLQCLRRGENHGSDSFKEDFEKYGAADFEGYILETGVTPAKFREREAFWIAEYRSTNPLYGYNKDAMEAGLMMKITNGLPPRLPEVVR